MRRALNDKPFVVFGPVFSSNTMANMHLAQEAGVPQITGSEAAVITQKGNLNIFRISFTQAFTMAKVAKWMAEDLKAEKVAAIWVNDAWGKGGWDNFNKEWKDRGKSVLVNTPTETGQVDFTAELTKAKDSGAKDLWLLIHEDESARLMSQLRKMGLQFGNIIGETTLCSEQTLHLAKEAVEGVKCHVGLTASAPLPGIREAGEKYTARTGRPADHSFLQGYVSAYMVKAVVEATGSFDQAKFRSCLHGMYLEAAKEPGLFMDMYMDDHGDVDRQSFMVEVKGGKNVVTKVLPMLRTGYPRKSCK
jgi:branched-chain amino acid transport system substrate-binding protein